jgi:hypothetical protein
MKWLKAILGQPVAQASTAPVTRDYGEYRVIAQPRQEPGGYRVAGTIRWMAAPAATGDSPAVEFVRADIYGSHEVAAEMTLLKGMRLVDEQGSALFPAQH